MTEGGGRSAQWRLLRRPVAGALERLIGAARKLDYRTRNDPPMLERRRLNVDLRQFLAG